MAGARPCAVEGIQFARQHEMRPGRAGDADRGGERGVLVLGIEVGDDGHIVHVQGRKGDQVVLAVDAAQAPEVAFVQAAGGGLLVDADGHEIALAGLEGRGDIHVKGREAAFVVAGALAVHEDFSAVVHAVEMPEDALPGKGGRDLDPAAIEADVVRLVAGAFLVSGDGKTLDFPIGGHGDVLPVGVGGVGGGEIGDGGAGRQFALDGGAGAVIELEAPGAGHGKNGGIVRPEGDRREPARCRARARAPRRPPGQASRQRG